MPTLTFARTAALHAALLAGTALSLLALMPARAQAGATCGAVNAPFSATNLPNECWRPYSDDSPFNKPIPGGARVHPRSAEIVRRVLGFGQVQNMVAGEAGTENDWWHPTYYSQPGDPVFKLHCTESWGRCSIEGHEIRIPDAARPAAGGDAHMTIVDQQSGWEYDLWTVESKPAGGGTLSFKWGGRTRIDGDGLNSDATAAKFGNLAGIIRAQELDQGQINHALFMVIRCDSGQHVYPATKTGRKCSDVGISNQDAPPMGARFQLNMSDAQIDALSVPPWKKAILRAMARYGLYFGDTGSSSWAIQGESGSTYTSFGRQDGLVTVGQKYRVPTYNGKPIFNVKDGVDWSRYLRVIDPCITDGSCTADPNAEPPPPGPGEVESNLGAPEGQSPQGAPTAGSEQSTASQPASRPGPRVSVRVRLTAPGRRVVTALGNVTGRRSGTVRLTAYHAKPGRGFARIRKRVAVVRRSRFRAPLSRFQRGRWRVDAVVTGTSARYAERRRLGDGDGSGGQLPPVRDDGRLGGGDSEGAGAPEAPGPNAASEGEARFDSPAVSPGPLAGGGYISRFSGSSERAVRSLEERLAVAGFATVGDGRFDTSTERAVRRFQEAHGLQVDGIVGRQTMTALEEYGAGR